MTRRSPATAYADEQRRILSRLGLDDESLLDEPFIYRADVVPAIGSYAEPPFDGLAWQWQCACSRRGTFRDPEAARSAAIEHVKTHEHHVPTVRVFGREGK